MKANDFKRSHTEAQRPRREEEEVHGLHGLTRINIGRKKTLTETQRTRRKREQRVGSNEKGAIVQ